MTDEVPNQSTEERLTGPQIIELLASRFTSLNPIPVERATIKRHEWKKLLEDIRDAGELGFHGGRHNARHCHSCDMADAIRAALEKL